MPAIEALLPTGGSQQHRRGQPLVTLSFAQSLDGSLAARRGSPLALSGPESLTLTHRLRAAHEAILVGIGTVLADNPRLTVRLAAGPQPQPVVLDSRLRFPLDAALLAGPRPPWIAASQDSPLEKREALERAGARLLFFPPNPDRRIPLAALLEHLAGEGVGSLMVEGGAETLRSFLAHRLADQVIVTVAPVFVGGLPALGTGPPLSPFPRLKDTGCETLGEDWVIWGKLSSAA